MTLLVLCLLPTRFATMSANSSFTSYRYVIEAIRDTFDGNSRYRRFDRTSTSSTTKASKSATKSPSVSSPGQQRLPHHASLATTSASSSSAMSSSTTSRPYADHLVPRSSYSMLLTVCLHLLLGSLLFPELASGKHQMRVCSVRVCVSLRLKALCPGALPFTLPSFPFTCVGGMSVR